MHAFVARLLHKQPASHRLARTARWPLSLWLLLAGSAFAQTHTKTEVITYHDNTSLWMLGQVASVTDAGTGQAVSESYPASVAVHYAINALGQTTQVVASTPTPGTVTLASNASYYPNGALKQFTYGNGIVHTMNRPG